MSILVVNPAASTTGVALFDGGAPVVETLLSHSQAELAPYPGIWDQFPLRFQALHAFLGERGISLDGLAAVVAPGGLLSPRPGGVYPVDGAMLEELRRAERGEHPTNLGALLAYHLGRQAGVPAFIVDPLTTDELVPEARLTGAPDLARWPLSHALGSRAVARRVARALGKPYAEAHLVVAYLGAGISVAAHRLGRMVDVSNALEGGPFSPERAGTLPVGDLLRRCFSGEVTERQLLRQLTAEGGLYAHLGTKDWGEVERRIASGDAHARLIYEAMAYGVSKEIAAMAVACRGGVDAVVLTGPLARSVQLTDWICERVAWIGPVVLQPDAGEMAAMAEAVTLRLTIQEEASRSL
jgi:butyrate kinase